MTLLLAVLPVVADLIKNLVDAKDDAAKQEEAMMAAEEKLSRIRAKQKFG